MRCDAPAAGRGHLSGRQQAQDRDRSSRNAPRPETWRSAFQPPPSPSQPLLDVRRGSTGLPGTPAGLWQRCSLPAGLNGLAAAPDAAPNPQRAVGLSATCTILQLRDDASRQLFTPRIRAAPLVHRWHGKVNGSRTVYVREDACRSVTARAGRIRRPRAPIRVRRAKRIRRATYTRRAFTIPLPIEQAGPLGRPPGTGARFSLLAGRSPSGLHRSFMYTDSGSR